MGKKRLEDLYVVGKLVRINDDGDDDPVEIWMQKLYPFQATKALAAADSKRASILALQKNRASEDFQEIISEVFTKTKDELVNEVAAKEISEHIELVEAELSAEEEWSKDNYLEGLRDAWGDVTDEESLSRRYLENPEDLEAKNVFGEFERLAQAITEKVEIDQEHILNNYRVKSMEALQELWTDQKLEIEADMIWVKEFRKQEVFYATRTPEDHKKYYFSTRADLDYLSSEIWFRLLNEYLGLSVEVSEGKDLRPTGSSSPEQEPQNNPETEAFSGPQDAFL